MLKNLRDNHNKPGIIRRYSSLTHPALTFDTYQTKAKETAIYYKSQSKNDWFVYPLLGLSGEVGELTNKFKKVIRDGRGEITEEQVQAIKDELGDVLWYFTQLCTDFGITVNEVARRNLEKLEARKVAGTIGGSGDVR